MQHRHSDFKDSLYRRDIRRDIGHGLRDHYDLAEPLPQSLCGLLAKLETRVRHTTRERLFEQVEQCLGDMIRAAGRTPELGH